MGVICTFEKAFMVAIVIGGLGFLILNHIIFSCRFQGTVPKVKTYSCLFPAIRGLRPDLKVKQMLLSFLPDAYLPFQLSSIKRSKTVLHLYHIGLLHKEGNEPDCSMSRYIFYA